MNSVIIVIISGMHHWECVASNVDISFQSGRFWATSIASFRERLLDFRSCWIVLNVLLTAKITLLFVRIWPIYDLIDERHCWFTVSWGCVHTLCVLWAVLGCVHTSLLASELLIEPCCRDRRLGCMKMTRLWLVLPRRWVAISVRCLKTPRRTQHVRYTRRLPLTGGGRGHVTLGSVTWPLGSSWLILCQTPNFCVPLVLAVRAMKLFWRP